MLIFNRSQDILENRSLKLHFKKIPNSEIHLNIIKILSDFAKGDRYSNINILVGKVQTSDPMEQWENEVDRKLFEKHISKSKKEKILFNADIISELTQDITLVRHVSESGSSINTVFEGSLRTGIQEAVSPYRQLYILQIIRFWVELVRELGYIAQSFGKEDIPFFGEIFGLFNNSDEYFKSRKTWDRIH